VQHRHVQVLTRQSPGIEKGGTGQHLSTVMEVDPAIYDMGLLVRFLPVVPEPEPEPEPVHRRPE
jgi:hypothetical protein